MITRFLFGKMRQDRWWRYHVLRKAYVRAQHSAREDRPLRQAFWRLGYGTTPEELRVFWCDLVALGASRQLPLRAEDLQALELRAGQLPPLLVSGKCWLDLFRLCIGIGFFQLARILRSKGLERIRMEGDALRASLEQVAVACYADVEAEAFQAARARLPQMETQGCSRKRLEQAEWFISLMASEKDSRTTGQGHSLSVQDRDFDTLIRGKRVALVGPVPSKAVQGGTIDDHDVVVKFGYRGGDKGRDPEIQGARLDVSYYNNSQAKLLAESGYDGVLASIQWAVCNNRKGRSRFPDNHPKLRLVASLQWLLPDTHLNAGPNAVLDLLRFKPSAINIFNTDMMLSSGRFAGYIPEGAGAIDYTRSFIKTHDPLLQYQLMRRLWVCGHIAGDKRFEEVMNMGLEGYLNELQKAYGADTQALL